MPKQSIKLVGGVKNPVCVQVLGRLRHQLQRIGRTGRKRDGKVHVLMSENREDANWDSAQQTHREIQEEILHSRNLELFEDVEPLLPLGKFPKCVEQEMPVDPWDPADQRSKRKLVSASQKERNKEEKAAKKSKQRGHEIPEGAHDGFKSVGELLRGQGKKAGKKGAKAVVRVMSESESEEDDEGHHDDDGDDDDDCAEDGEANELLYGPVKSKAQKGGTKTKKATGRTTKVAIGEQSATIKKKGKVAQPDVRKANAREEKEKEEAAKREAREAMNQSALDFFRTESSLRRRAHTPLDTPPSSPPICSESAINYPPSPLSDRSSPGVPLRLGTKSDKANKLSPRTAAIAGFSQVAPIDLSWDGEFESQHGDLDLDINMAQDDEETLGKEKSTKSVPMVLDKPTDMMLPPPIPINLSSPALGMESPYQATQFPVRRVGRRAPIVAHVSSDTSDSPSGRQPRRIRRRIDSSPLVPGGRQQQRPRAPAGEVKQLVSANFGCDCSISF